MSEANVLGCLISIVLPWLCGYYFVILLSGPKMLWSCRLAHGYLIGLLIMTLVIRLFDAVQIPFSFWSTVYCLMFISILEFTLIKLKAKRNPDAAVITRESKARTPQRQWKIALIGLFLVIFAYKTILAANEIMLLPLFPWDAWDSWAPLTIQYYDSGNLTADFSTKASVHGKTVSIIHLWGMLACETSSHPLTKLSWLFAWLAISLAIYGHVLKITSSPVAAILGAYLSLSLPTLYIHTALAGYADIWLTLAFTLGVLSLSLYRKKRHPGLLVLTVAYIVACISMKESGILVGGCLLILVGFTFIFTSRWARLNVLLIFCVGAFVLTIAVYQYAALTIDVPFIGTVIISSSVLSVPGYATYYMEYKSIALPLFESLFLYSQTHLLTPMIVITMGMITLSKQWELLREVSFLAVMLGGFLIWFYFSVADFEGAMKHTGLTRALICLMPAAIYWCVVSWTYFVKQVKAFG